MQDAPNAGRLKRSQKVWLVIAACIWFTTSLGACADGDRRTSHTDVERMRVAHDATIDRVACAAKGGAVKAQGMFGFGSCVTPYPDAGRTCSAKQDCAGRCLAASQAAPGTSAVGYCQPTDAWEGCYSDVERGVVSETLCRD